MKDIPMFTSEYGIASLFLKEIPYRGRAHIKIQSSLEPDKLLEECISFCRMCGAQWIDAAGHEYLEKYPLITSLSLMTRPLEGLPSMDACLFPMTEATMQKWLDICNERMAHIPNAAFMDSKDGKELLEKGHTIYDACFDSGFSDYSNFITTFRKHFGITPRHFQDSSR